MRNPLFWLLLLGPATGPAVAQVPQPGIYRVSKRVDYRPAAEYNYGVKTFTAPQHHPFVADLGVRYCLVAIDSTEHQLKTRLVFLAPPPNPTPPLAFEGGFNKAADSTFSVWYGGNGQFEAPPSNALRFFDTSFLLHANALTYDSGAGNPSQTYVANDPTRRLTVSPRNSLFALREARPYRTLLAIEPDRAPFYAAPDTARRSQTSLVKGQYVAVLSETKAWYEAETVSPNGTRHQGWLWKPDLVQRVWVPQTNQTADFRFEVAYHDTLAAADAENRATALTIRVISRKTGRVQQVLDSVGQNKCWADYQANISVIDCNFDGYPDLMLFAHDGGAGPNSGYLFYLYDPATNKFMFHEGLSDLTQTEINQKTQTIAAAWRNGCCDHGYEEYRFIGGKLTLVAQREEAMLISNLDRVVVTEGRLVKGKWREKSRKVKTSTLLHAR